MPKQQVKPPLSVLITDLDNTLFDWVAFWHASFKAMLDAIVASSGIPIEQLEREIKAVFQTHGTSEYAFLIQELPALKAMYPGEDLAQRFDGAIHAYRSARKRTLRLYPGVLSSLRELKRRGCLVVGYTESMAFYSNYRVRALGLDGLLDYLYSPEDHDLPSGLTPEQLRHYAPEVYQLRHTKHCHTPRGVLKPSPAVLLDIIKHVGAAPETTAYVGDSLMKDVAMAKEVGVCDVHAAYGVAQDRQEYELLRRVTHWSAEIVQREKTTTVETLQPTVSLKTFDELLDRFELQSFVPPRQSDDPHLKEVLEAWKTTVSVQIHFNDLALRIRNYAITILLASLGAAGVAFKDDLAVELHGLRLSLASILLAAGLVGWSACYFMDRWWYHLLLLGAVRQGTYVERRLRVALPEAELTGAIGRESPVRLPSKLLGIPVPSWAREVHSSRKIDIFYGGVAVLLVVAALLAAAPMTGGAGHAAGSPVATTQGPPTPQPSPSVAPSPSLPAATGAEAQTPLPNLTEPSR